MAVAEVERKVSVRRIYDPSNAGSYIPLKVIDSITFRETAPPFQEWELSFSNNPDDQNRTSHVVNIGASGSAPLKVERIDTIDFIESQGIRQEAIWYFLNNEQDPPVHLETYKKKIYLSDKDGNIIDRDTWIEVQRIRKIAFMDAKDSVINQESEWTLFNPDEDDETYDYTGVSQAITKWDFTTINPPYRLDPFQTIVDCQFGKYMLVLHSNNQIAAIPMSKIENPKVSYRGKSAANWYEFTDNYYTQLKLAEGRHIVSASIKIAPDGTISDPGNFNLSLINTSYSLLEGVEDNAVAYGAYNTSGALPLNGTATSVFTVHGRKFVFEKSGKPKASRQPPSSWRGQGVSVITKDGKYYGGMAIEAASPFGLSVAHSGGSGPYFSSDQSEAVSGAWPPNNNDTPQERVVGHSESTGPGVGDISSLIHTYTFYYQFGPIHYSYSGGQTGRYMIYSNDGKIDHVTSAEYSGSYSGYCDNEPYVISNVGVSMSVKGFSGTRYSNTTWKWSDEEGQGYWEINGEAQTGYKSVWFPTAYHFGESNAEMYITYLLPLDEDHTFTMTPFESRNDLLYIEPRNFVANGKHYITNLIEARYNESTGTTRTSRFYLGRTEYTERLKSAIGVSDAMKIQYIFLDVKMSDIKKLK